MVGDGSVRLQFVRWNGARERIAAREIQPAKTMIRLLLAVAALLVGPAASAQAGWPAGPSTYTHDAATLVALPHQRASLGLSDAQVDALAALSRDWLDQVHDVRGDLRALREAIHVFLGAVGPGAPMDPEEAVSLFADIDRHEAEVREVFREGAGPRSQCSPTPSARRGSKSWLGRWRTRTGRPLRRRDALLMAVLSREAGR